MRTKEQILVECILEKFPEFDEAEMLEEENIKLMEPMLEAMERYYVEKSRQGAKANKKEGK